jgi:VanZ family protein
MASIWGLDDVAHVPVFAGLAALLLILVSRRSTLGRGSVLVAAVCLAIGVAVELIQWTTSTRSAEMVDLWYDLLGVVIGLGIAAVGLQFASRLVLAVIVVVGVIASLAALPESRETSEFSYRSSAVEQRCRNTTPAPAADEEPGGAIESAPLVLYRFDEGRGFVIHDGVGDLDLEIGDTTTVKWATSGGLIFDGEPHRTRSQRSATEVSAALEASDAASIEAWFVAASLPQSGPVRLATISEGTHLGEANVHLGIEGHSVTFRIATDCDEFNQTSSDEELRAGVLHHVVATYRPGVVEIFVDGELAVSDTVQYGHLRDWDLTRRLYIADEATADRTFAGTIRYVAVHDRALTSADVARLYNSAGDQ